MPELPRRSALQRLLPWLGALLSGILLTLSFPPADIGGLAFIALTPLLAAVWLGRTTKRKRLFYFGLGYCTGLIFFTTTFWWLGELANLYDSFFLKMLPASLALYLSLYPALWAMLAGWLGENHFVSANPDAAPPKLLSSTRNLAIALILAATWTGMEWLRNWLFTGFGWNMLGASLHQEITMIQIADITGIGGISFLLIVSNITGLLTILRLKAEIGRIKIRPHFDFTLTMLMVTLSFAYGIRTLMKAQPPEATSVNVAALQPNIPQLLKFDNSRANEVFDRLGSLNELASITYEDMDLMLWPEATIPGGMFGDVGIEQFVRNEGARGNFMLLLGTDDNSKDGKTHNSAALVSKNRSEVMLYHKMHLVPFGEYLPFRSLLDGPFGNLVPGDFDKGEEYGVFTLDHPQIKIAPLVCFEDTDGELTRVPVQNGAQLLVNITNDGWFGKSCEPYQHFYNSIFRCIETRRPMVRCTNTGLTGSVDIFGRTDIWLEPHITSFALRKIRIPANLPMTFYTRHGELFSKICVAFSVLCIAIIRLRRRRRRGIVVAASL